MLASQRISTLHRRSILGPEPTKLEDEFYLFLAISLLNPLAVDAHHHLDAEAFDVVKDIGSSLGMGHRAGVSIARRLPRVLSRMDEFCRDCLHTSLLPEITSLYPIESRYMARFVPVFQQ